MLKNTLIVLVIIIVIIVGGIIVFNFLQKEKAAPTQESAVEEEPSEESAESSKEIFSLSATVLSVDSENNFLMVKPKDQETEIKVILSEETKIKKLGVPSGTGSTSGQGGVFTPIEKYIEISDIRTGDKLFITTGTNIAGKSEFNDVKMIQVYP